MIELGLTVKDKITGFTGVTTGRAQYITGCDQYLVAKKASNTGDLVSNWFDENRLEIQKNVKQIFISKTEDNKTGGPVMNPAPKK